MYRDAEGRPGMLDELVGTIETLKARISEHRSILQASEAQTRLSLIDPLLRALGWDTDDRCAVVRPAIYALKTLTATGRRQTTRLDANQRHRGNYRSQETK